MTIQTILFTEKSISKASYSKIQKYFQQVLSEDLSKDFMADLFHPKNIKRLQNLSFESSCKILSLCLQENIDFGEKTSYFLSLLNFNHKLKFKPNLYDHYFSISLGLTGEFFFETWIQSLKEQTPFLIQWKIRAVMSKLNNLAQAEQQILNIVKSFPSLPNFINHTSVFNIQEKVLISFIDFLKPNDLKKYINICCKYNLPINTSLEELFVKNQKTNIKKQLKNIKEKSFYHTSKI